MILILSLSITFPVYADDTEDLLNVYNLTLGKTTKSEMEQEIDAIKNEIANSTSVKNDVDTYNAVLSSFLKTREDKLNELQKSIVEVSNKNEVIAESISKNLLDGNIKDLLVLDSSYKRNKVTVDELFKSLDYYVSDYSFKDYNDNISSLNSKLEEARQVYISSLDTYNLGDVKDIKFILSNNRNVISKYGYRVSTSYKNEIRFHSGTDYFCESDTNVHALFNGEVISVGNSKSIGKFIVIQSGENIKYLICHISNIYVKEGDVVKQYQIIASGSDSCKQNNKNHIHVALYINGCSYDVDRLFSKSEK